MNILARMNSKIDTNRKTLGLLRCKSSSTVLRPQLLLLLHSVATSNLPFRSLVYTASAPMTRLYSSLFSPTTLFPNPVDLLRRTEEQNRAAYKLLTDTQYLSLIVNEMGGIEEAAYFMVRRNLEKAVFPSSFGSKCHR